MEQLVNMEQPGVVGEEEEEEEEAAAATAARGYA
jgi:hypothetical protein